MASKLDEWGTMQNGTQTWHMCEILSLQVGPSNTTLPASHSLPLKIGRNHKEKATRLVSEPQLFRGAKMEGDKRELKSSNSGSFQYAKSQESLHGSNLHWRHLPQSGTLLGHDQMLRGGWTQLTCCFRCHGDRSLPRTMKGASKCVKSTVNKRR